MKIVVATNNAHKLVEIRSILEPLDIEVLGARDVGGIPEVEEDGDSFVANAIIKAEAGVEATGMAVIADDSGLEVFALDGEPGIYSSRYAGDDATDADRMAKLQFCLQGHEDRSARFVCVIAVATEHGVIGTVEGEVRGKIASAPMGESGFGYDPIFVPDGYDKSFGQLPSELKDSISHRANALKNLVESGLLEKIGEQAR